MEASPNQNTESMNDREKKVIKHIDKTLAEYDHQRIVEESNWADLADLQELVDAGQLDPDVASQRYLEWFRKYHEESST